MEEAGGKEGGGSGNLDGWTCGDESDCEPLVHGEIVSQSWALIYLLPINETPNAIEKA